MTYTKFLQRISWLISSDMLTAEKEKQVTRYGFWEVEISADLYRLITKLDFNPGNSWRISHWLGQNCNIIEKQKKYFTDQSIRHNVWKIYQKYRVKQIEIFCSTFVIWVTFFNIGKTSADAIDKNKTIYVGGKRFIWWRHVCCWWLFDK